jgi:hypothetical protein
LRAAETAPRQLKFDCGAYVAISAILPAVALNLDREAKELSVILLEPLEVRLDRSRDFSRVLDREEWPTI